MELHNEADFVIYFSDKNNEVPCNDYAQAYSSKGLFIPKACTQQPADFASQKTIFLQQTHSTDGIVISEQNNLANIECFSRSGDYLITNQKNISLGILTADCLPIIIYDPINHVIANIHAGLKGSLAGIATTVVKIMTENFASNSKELRIFFGPAARGCCYQISETVVEKIKNWKQSSNCLLFKNQSYYLDLALFNQIQLSEIGIPETSFCQDYACCTICDNRYNSYRRDGKQAGRNITLAMLI